MRRFVRRFVSTVPLAVALLLASAAEGWAQRTFVLVRHAEKLDHSDDPPLSPVGRARASALADLLRGAGVTAIVATEYQRTQATAAPLAKRLGIAPEIVPARQLDALVARLHASAAGSVVLVVGHSNTVPIVLTRLGWKGTLDLHDRDYDDVFVVVPREGAEPSVLRLKYGRKTSP